MPHETELVINQFDYQQYKKGVITTRLQMIVEYIVSLASPSLRVFLRGQPFELICSDGENGCGKQVDVQFCGLPNNTFEDLKKLPCKLTLINE